LQLVGLLEISLWISFESAIDEKGACD